MINRFLVKVKEDRDSIVEAMSSQGWKKITFGRFLSYAAAGLALVDAIAAGGLLTTVAAAFGTGAAVFTTYQESIAPNGMENSFTTYAALASKL
jgi:hypothetical protein